MEQPESHLLRGFDLLPPVPSGWEDYLDMDETNEWLEDVLPAIDCNSSTLSSSAGWEDYPVTVEKEPFLYGNRGFLEGEQLAMKLWDSGKYDGIPIVLGPRDPILNQPPDWDDYLLSFAEEAGWEDELNKLRDREMPGDYDRSWRDVGGWDPAEDMVEPHNMGENWILDHGLWFE